MILISEPLVNMYGHHLTENEARTVCPVPNFVSRPMTHSDMGVQVRTLLVVEGPVTWLSWDRV